MSRPAPTRDVAEPDPAAVVGALNGASVLVVGDVMLDRYVYGGVDRISPEAPIPVLRIERESAMLGGAGNVVRNLVALGARACFVSVVGRDDAGIQVTGLVGEEAGVEPHLIVEAGRTTTVKMRYVAGAQQILRADRETVAPVEPASEGKIGALAAEAMADVRVLVLSDYGKGVLTPVVIAGLVSAAKQRGLTVVCDPKGRDYARYRGIDVLTPNRRELAEAVGRPVSGDDAVVAAARELIARHALGAVLVTRSEEGMSLIRTESALHLPAKAREVFDVSGAGDTVIATLSAAIAGGLALDDAAALANLAGGIVVGKVGTAVVHPEDLLDVMHDTGEPGQAKIATRAAAVDRIARWRRGGQRIGFTNGCFDLIHPGHVSLLGQARSACDRLVVGLNTDASVKRLKGPTRPLLDEKSRATVLAAFESVDLVVTFDEDTPLELIQALRPDVLVKGADYTIDKVVGADLVQSYGGKVVLAEIAAGHSTTGIVQRFAR